MRIVIVFLIFSNLGCNSISSHIENDKADSPKYFKDIDLPGMKGISQEYKNPENGSILVDHINDLECKITYHDNSLVGINTFHYNKINKNFWSGSFSNETDSCGPLIYEFILKDKIIELTYCKSENMQIGLLEEVSVFKEGSFTTYILNNRLIFTPDTSAIDFALHNYKTVYISKITRRNGVLSFHDQLLDRENKVLSAHIHCYKDNERSSWWWKYFRLNQSKNVCDSI